MRGLSLSSLKTFCQLLPDLYAQIGQTVFGFLAGATEELPFRQTLSGELPLQERCGQAGDGGAREARNEPTAQVDRRATANRSQSTAQTPSYSIGCAHRFFSAHDGLNVHRSLIIVRQPLASEP